MGQEQLWPSPRLGDIRKSRQVGGLEAPVTAQPQGVDAGPTFVYPHSSADGPLGYFHFGAILNVWLL